MKHSFNHGILVIILILLISSCDSMRLYEKNIEFDDKEWIVDSIASFEFNITSSKDRYNIYYNLRNTIAYPYQNIYIHYSLEDTLGQMIKSDLINKQLFDSKTGKPYGSGLGDIMDHQFQILSNYKFDRIGVYRLNLRQEMRKDTLPEILSVGVRVEFDENKK